jgi:hypothetical protein
MQETAKKAYSKPQIEEVARLDRFIGSGYDQMYNDNKKFEFNMMFIYFETSVKMMG